MSTLEESVSAAAGADWSWFEKLGEDVRQRVELEKAKTEEERKMIARAWAGFAATKDGAAALELLFGSTIRRTVFFVSLNLPPDQVASWGFFREGQNAVAFLIARLIAEGRAEPPPQPRDV